MNLGLRLGDFDLQAMAVPEVAVVTEPDCRRKEMVLPDLWSQVTVVESPAVKV